MNIFLFLISLLISIVPIFLIGYIFYNRDLIKEPKGLLRKLFISGIFSGIIVIIISCLGLILFPNYTDISKINNIFILIFYCYIFIALTEECSKLIMIYKISYNNKEFDQAYDIILYSVFVGLGFGFFENIIYLLSNPNIQTAFLRGITAIPAHTCFQTLMGYYLYLSKTKDKKHNIFLSLIIPIILHGSYDIFIFLNSTSLIIIDLLLLIVLIIYANSKIKYLLKIDKNNLTTKCPVCNTQINHLYCPNCGYKK